MKIINAPKRYGKPVTDEVLQEAIERGKQLYGDIPKANGVRFLAKQREIEIDFENGNSVLLPIDKLKEFNNLSNDQLSRLLVGFAGKGLYLDEADLHVSINGLIAECNLNK